MTLSAPRPARRRGQRRQPRLLPRRTTTPALLGRLTGPRPWQLSTSSATAWSTTRGPAVVAGAHGRPTPSAISPGPSPTNPTLPVWQILLAGLRWCDRFVDGDDRERLQAFVRALVGPALDRLGWEPRPGRGRAHRRAAGHAHPRPGVLGDDPDAQAPGPRAPRAAARRPGQPSTPTVAAAALAVVAATGDRRRLRRATSSASARARDTRRTSCATCTRWPTSPTADLMDAHPGLRLRAARSRPRTRRSCCGGASPTATRASRPGGSSASTGTKPTPASRTTPSCAWSTR